jgi:hypothetical protein
VIIACGAAASRAEDSAEPFSRFTLELSALGSGADETFDDFWEPGAGGELAALASIPHGSIELAVHAFANDPRSGELPEVDMLMTWLGAGADLPLPGRLTLRGGVRAGVAWMFYDATPTTSEQDENELAFGGRASLEFPVSGAWAIHVDARAARILTHEPIDIVSWGGGISRTFATPEWLRRFLE